MKETPTPEKPLSKKTQINKAKYAVVSQDRLIDRLKKQIEELTIRLDIAESGQRANQKALDLLLA